MHAAHLAQHIVVDHLQGQPFGNTLQRIPRRQTLQVKVGVNQQTVEGIPLSNAPELLPVGRAEKLVEALPVFRLGQ